MGGGNFFGWARIIRNINKSEYKDKRNNSKEMNVEFPEFIDFLKDVKFVEKGSKLIYKSEDENYELKVEVFEPEKNGYDSVSSIYFRLFFKSENYSDNIYLEIKRDYKNFFNDEKNKLIILPVYTIGKSEDFHYGDYHVYVRGDSEPQMHFTTRENKHTLKKDLIELNRAIINAKRWMFPLIEFRELYFSHQEIDNALFNIFYPIEIRERYLLTVPVIIKRNKLNKLQRFKLHEEIGKFLDMVSLMICITYSLSIIKERYLKLIEKQLFRPWQIKLSQKFKECEGMHKLPFADFDDIDKFFYLALTVLETHHSYEYIDIDKEILIESIHLFMKDIYGKHKKIEDKINRFIQIHENIPIAILTLLTVIIGLIQIKS